VMFTYPNRMLETGRCIGHRPRRQLEFLRRRAHRAKVVFEPGRLKQDKDAHPGRSENKCVRFEFREEQALSGTYLESFLPHIGVHVALEDVEELILALVHVWRRFVPGSRNPSTKAKAPPVSLLSARMVSRLPMYQMDESWDGPLL
jgi:hypothetical protein